MPEYWRPLRLSTLPYKYEKHCSLSKNSCKLYCIFLFLFDMPPHTLGIYRKFLDRFVRVQTIAFSDGRSRVKVQPVFCLAELFLSCSIPSQLSIFPSDISPAIHELIIKTLCRMKTFISDFTKSRLCPSCWHHLRSSGRGVYVHNGLHTDGRQLFSH